MQKIIHEQKVLSHAFVAGHSSYALLQRPRGDAPFLLFHCLQDTSFECIYKTPAQGDDWIGTDLFAVHSNATKDLRNWHWNPWVNGHSSLVLEPGQKRESYQMRFVFLDNYAEITKELMAADNLGIRIVPSMVVQEDEDSYVEVNCVNDLQALEIHSDGITLKERKRTDRSTLLTLSFHADKESPARIQREAVDQPALFLCRKCGTVAEGARPLYGGKAIRSQSGGCVPSPPYVFAI